LCQRGMMHSAIMFRESASHLSGEVAEWLKAAVC
jgi:hypothetical protein